MKTIFVSHGFRFHKPWKQLNTLIERRLTEMFLNVSVPWHDPSFLPYDSWGKEMIDKALESQATEIDVLVIIESLLMSGSSKKYVKREIEVALGTSPSCLVITYCDRGTEDIKQVIEDEIESDAYRKRILDGLFCLTAQEVIASICLGM